MSPSSAGPQVGGVRAAGLLDQLVHRERHHVGGAGLVHPALVQLGHGVQADRGDAQLGGRADPHRVQRVARHGSDQRLVHLDAGLVVDLDRHLSSLGRSRRRARAGGGVHTGEVNTRAAGSRRTTLVFTSAARAGATLSTAPTSLTRRAGPVVRAMSGRCARLHQAPAPGQRNGCPGSPSEGVLTHASRAHAPRLVPVHPARRVRPRQQRAHEQAFAISTGVRELRDHQTMSSGRPAADPRPGTAWRRG